MRLLNSLSATSSWEISRATRRRAAMSSALASVIRRSTQRRSSLALASVVVIRPCASRSEHRLRISALRALVSRLKWRPLFRCLIALPEYRLHGVRLDEALLDQLLLDLVQRLATEVAEAEQLVLLLGQELADRRDVVRLQTVECAHREVELLDRDLVEPVAGGLLAARRGLVRLDVVAEPDEQLEVLREQRRRAADRLLGGHRAVRPHLEVQAVVVGRLADAGLLDQEVRLHDRREDGVDRDHADRLPFALVAVGGNVALAALHRQLHPQVTAVGQRADVQVRVHDLDVRGRLDLGGVHLRRALDVEHQRDRVLREALEAELLEVEDDLGHVFLDMRHRGELVRHALDLDRRDRRAPQRAEQHPAQRVAERGAEPGLEWLDLELAVPIVPLDLADLGGHGQPGVNRQRNLSWSVPSSAGIELDDQVLLDTLLHLVSLRQCEHLARLLPLVERQPGRNGAYSGRLEREGDDGAVPAPHLHLVAGLQLVCGDVDDPAVHVEVPVGDELPGLPSRGRQPQPVDDVVETQLEVPQEVEAGDPALSHRRVEVVAELPLEQAVRAPRLLLRAELQPVVRGLSPACLAVHARRHGAALDGALGRVAALTLQVELRALPAAETAHGAVVVGQLSVTLLTRAVAWADGSHCAGWV